MTVSSHVQVSFNHQGLMGPPLLGPLSITANNVT